MKFSIVIPVYNVEQYLHECLDSIVKQKCCEYEVILVDDGSKDSSGNICDEYASKYDYVSVYHTDNYGASHARNVGIEHAQGEWISFVDADDWVEEKYFDILTDCYSEDIVYFGAIKHFEEVGNEYKIPQAFVSCDSQEIEQCLFRLKYGRLNDIFGWTWNKFFKKSIIDKECIRFPERLVFREDEIFTMTYCRYIHSMRILDKTLYNYRVRTTGLTGGGMQENDYLELANHLEELIPYYHCPELIRNDRQRIANYHIDNFLRKISLWTMSSDMNEAYHFFKEKPDYKQYASNQQIVRMLSHSKSIAFLLLEWYHILSTLRNRL